jgi:hypothetical protein
MNKSEDCRLVVAKRYTRRDERLRIMEAWRQSGLSVVEFAAQKGMAVRKLYRWRGAKASTPPEASALIELPSILAGGWTAEVTSKVGAVRLAGSASPVWAASLIRELNRC